MPMRLKKRRGRNYLSARAANFKLESQPRRLMVRTITTIMTSFDSFLLISFLI